MMPRPVGRCSSCRAGGGLVMSNRRCSAKPMSSTQGFASVGVRNQKKRDRQTGDFVEHDLLRIFFAAQMPGGDGADRNSHGTNHGNHGRLKPSIGQKTNAPCQRQPPDCTNGARGKRRSAEPKAGGNDHCRMSPVGNRIGSRLFRVDRADDGSLSMRGCYKAGDNCIVALAEV